MANFFEGRIEIDIDKAALTDLFQKKAEKAFQKVANDLEGRFTAAIDGAHWSWTGQSKRGLSGSTVGERAKSWADSSFNVGSPRDIIDSGNLKGSLDVEINKADMTAVYTWTADYAAAVHEGAQIHPWGDPTNKKVQLPARPWTSAVLQGTNGVEKYDYLSYFKKYMGV